MEGLLLKNELIHDVFQLFHYTLKPTSIPFVLPFGKKTQKQLKSNTYYGMCCFASLVVGLLGVMTQCIDGIVYFLKSSAAEALCDPPPSPSITETVCKHATPPKTCMHHITTACVKAKSAAAAAAARPSTVKPEQKRRRTDTHVWVDLSLHLFFSKKREGNTFTQQL